MYNTQYIILHWKQVVVMEEEIKSYLLKLVNFEGFFDTNYKPIGGPRYQRNPINGW